MIVASVIKGNENSGWLSEFVSYECLLITHCYISGSCLNASHFVRITRDMGDARGAEGRLCSV